MIHLDERGSVAVLRLEHGKVNAIDAELFDELDRRLDEVERSPARALVVTGSGKMFSPGVDLFRVVEGGKPYLAEFLPGFSRRLQRFFSLPLPVVAAINGHAIAGGCILAAACDLRLMARDGGKIGLTELVVGVPFPAVALEVMRHLLPSRRVEELIYGGLAMSAEKGLELGLVDELVEGSELLDAACAAAERLGRIPTASFALTKRQLRQPALDRVARYGPANEQAMIEHWSAPETRRSIREFLAQNVGKK